MPHRKVKPNARRRIDRFVISRGFTFDFSVTGTFITASHIITVCNELLIFCIFAVSGRVTAVISLVIALVIRMPSVLVICAPPFPRLLLLIAFLVWGTRSSMLDWALVAGLSCTKGVWYIYDRDTG